MLRLFGSLVSGVLITTAAFGQSGVAMGEPVGCGKVTAYGDDPLECNLRRAVSPMLDKLSSGGHARLMIVGDSISLTPGSYHGYLRNHFWRRFGVGAVGYLGCSNEHTVTDPEEFQYSGMTAWWNDAGSASNIVRMRVSASRLIDINGIPVATGIYAPDGIMIRLRNSAFFNAQAYGPTARVHWLAQPGGGVMQVLLNGVVVDEVSTSSKAYEHRISEYTLPAGVLSSFRLRAKDSAWIQISGIEYADPDAPGLELVRLSRGGVGPSDYLLSANAVVADHIASLAPDLLWIMLDWSGADDYTNFVQNTKLLLDFYATSMPGTPVVLVSHHPFHTGIEEEEDQLRTIAIERGHGFINLNDLFDGYHEMSQIGFMADTVHLTPIGGHWFADYLFARVMHAWDPADWNLDGKHDFTDLEAMLSDHASRVKLADIAPSWGTHDGRDIGYFLHHFVAP